MKTLLAYTVTVLLATIAVSFAGPAADKDAIKAKEEAAWQAYKDKNADGFKKVIDKDFVGVYSDGIQDIDQEMASMQKWDMKSFSISDYKTLSDEKDVIVTTYTVKIEGSVDGKDASGTYNAGSVWKMENGQWFAIFHSNVKQDAVAK